MDARFETEAVRETRWGSERALWLGPEGERIFVLAHVPASEPRGAVLVCSSLFTDTIFNYRREVEVSRILAAAGLSVARFHVRGTGHSEGDPLETTFDSMVTDALAVSEYLLSGGHAASLGLLGSRWGALVAAGVARRTGDAPVAVWEPVVHGKDFLREALQASGVAHLASKLTGPSPKETLATEGVANILGFPMGKKLFDSGQDLELVDILSGSSGPVLYLGPDRGGVLAKPHDTVVQALRASRSDVTARVVAGPKAWWFVDEVNPTPLDAASETATWFEGVLGTEGTQGAGR